MAPTNVITMLIQMWPLLLQGLWGTVLVSTCALLIGFTGGIGAGILACKKLQNPLAPFIAGYVLLIRGTPVYVHVLIVYYALPECTGINLSACSAGVLALGCSSIAYVAEIVRGGINAVPLGQWDAAAVLGYSKGQALRYIIVPQALKTVLPSLINEIVAVLKDSSILAAIGLMELTKVATNISARTLDPISAYALVALAYFAITTAISFFAHYIEKKMEFVHD